MSLYYCTGEWKSGEQFDCVIVSSGSWNGKCDTDDEQIFFYTDGLPVLGDHGDFTITDAVEEEFEAA